MKQNTSLSTIKESYEREIADMKDKNAKERIALGAVAAATMAAKMKDLQEQHEELEEAYQSLSQKYCSTRLERNILRHDSVSSTSSSSSTTSMWQRAGLQHRVVLCVKCEIPSPEKLLEQGIHVVYLDSEKLLLKYLDSAQARVLLRSPDTSVRMCVDDVRLVGLVRDLRVDIPILVLSHQNIPKYLLNVNATKDEKTMMDFATFEDTMFKFENLAVPTAPPTPPSPRDRAVDYVRRQTSIRKWKRCLDSLRRMGFHDDEAALKAIEDNYERYPSSTIAQRISAVASLLSRTK